jgi:phage terminase small subunit
MATRKGSKVKAGNTQEDAANRRKLFIEAYLTNGGNASQAAIAAGYSPHTAGVTGSRLLKHAEVLAQLQQRRNALLSKLELTTESVLKSLAQAVHFDPRKLYDASGGLKPIHDLDEDTAMALSGFEVTEEKDRGKVVGFTKKVKWLDKNAAREQAMKHLGLYEQDNKQRNPLENLPRDVIQAIVDKLGATGGRG